jgi:hypothetical protein
MTAMRINPIHHGFHNRLKPVIMVSPVARV